MNIEKAKQLYESGKTLREVGEVFGVSDSTIGRCFKSVGYKVRTKSERARGPLNSSWKGGCTKTKDGYVMIRVDGHYVLEHRHVMEILIRRPLTSEEIVHHINKIPDDNRPENLKLCTLSTHRAEHVLKDQWSRSYDACIVCGTIERKHAGNGLCTRCQQYERTVELRGYECEYKEGKRIFSDEHKSRLSKAMRGNTNGIQNLKKHKKCCGK